VHPAVDDPRPERERAVEAVGEERIAGEGLAPEIHPSHMPRAVLVVACGDQREVWRREARGVPGDRRIDVHPHVRGHGTGGIRRLESGEQLDDPGVGDRERRVA
jgi:hypothetical protein